MKRGQLTAGEFKAAYDRIMATVKNKPPLYLAAAREVLVSGKTQQAAGEMFGISKQSVSTGCKRVLDATQECPTCKRPF